MLYRAGWEKGSGWSGPLTGWRCRSKVGELGKCLDSMRAVIVWTLVNGHFFLRLPAKENQSAVRTEEFRLPVCFEALLKLEELRAHLAEDLRAFLSVVEVGVGMWRTTAGADDMSWNR